jgi:hypothetical protein
VCAPFLVATLPSFPIVFMSNTGARVAYGNIEAFVHAIEKHNIWGAAQAVLSQDLPGTRTKRDQFPESQAQNRRCESGSRSSP